MKKYLSNLKKQEKREKEQRTEKINEKMVNYWHVNINNYIKYELSKCSY